MAYYQGGTHKPSYSNNNSSSSTSCFHSFGMTEQRLAMGVILVIFCGFVWYVVYDAIMKTAAEQLRRLLMVSPLLLIILVHWLSAEPSYSRGGQYMSMMRPVGGSAVVGAEKAGAIHRSGDYPTAIQTVFIISAYDKW
ncbi:uncharacterized protein LOC113308737 [Papaver somniferum]|uniref:uncharacterized protein LOC113308737 n=1 Tax=Papaver somniferum TaxID=3469 RepID=UPI000E6F82E0|nr:uncharacterized protein LOC113308737 [Papaver somniferum]